MSLYLAECPHYPNKAKDIIRDLDFFTGIRCNISPCCIDFYELCYLPSIKNQIPEYSETMWELSNETGILLCPNCIVKLLM